MTNKWDNYFKELTDVIASKSEDIHTKVGAIIIGEGHEIRSTGYNGLPRGIQLKKSRLTRPEKYYWMVHAEVNAIANAARIGVPLLGTTLYVSMIPCPDCTRLLIQAGIKEIIILKDKVSKKGKDDYRIFDSMTKETGIKVRSLYGTDCVI